MPPAPFRAAVCALAFAAAAAGCGTVANLNRAPIPGEPPPCRVFGGVREDANCIMNGPAIFGPILGAADLPFSLVGDVVTLPRTVKAARERKALGLGP